MNVEIVLTHALILDIVVNKDTCSVSKPVHIEAYLCTVISLQSKEDSDQLPNG
jgi:hypothetical protein